MWRWPAAIAWGVFGVTVAVVAAIAYQQFFAGRDEPNLIASAPATVPGGALSIRRAEKPRPVPGCTSWMASRSRVRCRHSAGASSCSTSGRHGARHAARKCRRSIACRRRSAGRGSKSLHCRSTAMALLKIKEFYKVLGLQRLGIYVDTGGDMATKLGAVGVPLTLLADPQGNEFWRVLGQAEWDQPAIVDRIRKEIGASPQ